MTAYFYSPQYEKAAIVLAESLKIAAPDSFPPLIVLYFAGEVPDHSLLRLAASGLNPVAVDRANFLPSRWHGKYLKLGALNMTQYDYIMFLDSDTRIIGSPQALFQECFGRFYHQGGSRWCGAKNPGWIPESEPYDEFQL